MLNENGNILLDFARFRVDLEFYNVSNFTYSKVEKIKRLILSNLTLVTIPQDAKTVKYFIKFINNSTKDVQENLLLLNKHHSFKLKFLILSSEKKEKFIQRFNNEANSDENFKNFMRLIIVSDYHFNEAMNKIKSNSPEPHEKVLYSKDDDKYLLNLLRNTLLELINLKQQNFKNSTPLIKGGSLTTKKYSEIKQKILDNIQFHNFKTAQEGLKIITTMVDKEPEGSRIKEYYALSLFLADYHKASTEETPLTFNREVETGIKTAISSYKKIKEIGLECEANLRLAVYYAYFPNHHADYEKVTRKLYEKSQSLPAKEKFDIMLRMSWLFHQKKQFRRENLNYYLCVNVCLKDKALLEEHLPFLFQVLQKRFWIQDIEHCKVDSYEKFEEVHRKIMRNDWKKTEYNLVNKDGSLTEFTKKKNDAGIEIVVKDPLREVGKYLFRSKWEKIQQSVFLLTLNYLADQSESTSKISFSLNYLQTLHDFLSKKEQENIIKSFVMSSLQMQRKLSVSLIKIPILSKIAPIPSDIKFDIIKNTKGDQLFLYNPWEKSGMNYYWTMNSFQNISIEFYNILKTEIVLSQLNIIFKTDNKDLVYKNYPTTVTIPPKSFVQVRTKVNFVNQGVVTIVGVRYDLFNTLTEQFVDSKGNGIFNNFEHIYVDPNAPKSLSNIKKKNYISLTNIKIYPEIPFLEVKLLNDVVNSFDGSISLFEYQYYMFHFMLRNVGNYPIDEIKCNVYAYKKEDYKILLKEIRASGENGKPILDIGSQYPIDYLYYHRKAHMKLEFRVYYVSYQKNSDSAKEDFLLKPFIPFFKPINTEKLITINKVDLSTKIKDTFIGDVVQKDNRLNRNYEYRYCNTKYYFSLCISNANQNKIRIILKDEHDTVIKEDILDDDYEKQIIIECDHTMNLNNLVLYWEFTTTDNFKGKIELKEIFQAFNYGSMDPPSLEFGVNMKDNGNSKLIEYTATNKSGRSLKKLKMYIYFYRFYNKGLEYNDKLPEGLLFYEGMLSPPPLGQLNDGESMSHVINIFKGEDFLKTACVIVDKEEGIVYLPNFDSWC